MRFGWRKNDLRTGHWYEDDCFFDDPDPVAVAAAEAAVAADDSWESRKALRVAKRGPSRIPQTALATYMDTGQGIGQYARPGTKPTRITFRTLSPDELLVVRGLMRELADTEPVTAMDRVYLAAFRVACDFPDLEGHVEDADGAKQAIHADDVALGVRALAPEFVATVPVALAKFFGLLVYMSSVPTEAEKKASSPPSGPPPSPAATAGASTTEPPPDAVATRVAAA